MNNYKWLNDFFVVYFGQDADEYGESYAEIVDSAFKIIAKNGLNHIDDLIYSIDSFRKEYRNNENAVQVLNSLTQGLAGDTTFYTPTLLDFLSWLSDDLKHKRNNFTP